ncbi:MAG: HlyD family efflux transporter periplasmic adaptor subunit, partial [Pseudomonadota bacterium]
MTAISAGEHNEETPLLDKVSPEAETGTNTLVTAAPTVDLEASPKKGGALRFISKTFLALLQAVLMIAVLVGAYFATQRLIATKPEPKKRPAFKTVYTVETVTAQVADNRPSFVVYGSTVAARTVDLRALVAGEIVSINENLRSGSRIEKGETLLTIDPFQYRGALAEAKANLAEAQGRIAENQALIAAEEAKKAPLAEQLALARADLERIETLLTRGTGTQQQVEARRLVVSQRQTALDQIDTGIAVQRARLTQLEASIARLDWKVEQAQRNLASTTLSAPFTGIVRTTSAEIGRNVSANDVVVSIYEADTLEASFTLFDAQFGRLAASDAGVVGRNVTVSWTVGGQTYDFPATIERLGSDIMSN